MPALFTFLGPLIGKVLDLIPDPAQRAQQMQAIIDACQAWDAQQNQVNQAEAQNPNLFVSGARPAALWVCVLALAYQYLFVPLATWGFAASRVAVPSFPTLDDNLWQLMTGLLGLGGMRMVEKLKGVA